MATSAKVKFATIDIFVNDNLYRDKKVWCVQAKSLVTMKDDNHQNFGDSEDFDDEEVALNYAVSWAEAISPDDTEQVVIFKNGSEYKCLKKE